MNLQKLARNTGESADEPEPERRTISHYQLEEVLGEGGMGRVYRARQETPIRRQVALKVMGHGLGDAGDQARFDTERQALARLGHPNIAQMFETGTTRDGKPWFAMELVCGVPITRYCDELRRGVAARLHTFMDALVAVQHAHQNQLLHRDLKPSNILVTEIDGVPMVKIIDFGIALGLDGDGGRASQRGHRAGTPGYAPPESLPGDDDGAHLDTRSDIYTLGVALYELLCGVRPFDQPGDTPKDVWRKIQEDTPLTPAEQFERMDREAARNIAAKRSTRPRQLAKTLSGDLGAIVMKAIARDPDRRYGSVSAFFRDLENVLNHKPVDARAQDFTYLAGLFVHRNRGPVLAVSLLLAVMAGGLVAWSEEAHRASLEANRASREALDRARLMQLLGEIYTEVYALDQAEVMVRKALDIRRAELGPGDPAIADSLGQLGDIFRIQMRYEDAEPLLREGLAVAQQADPPDPATVAQAWSRLGWLAWQRGDFIEALDIHRTVLDRRLAQLGEGHARTAFSQHNAALALASLGHLAEAESLLTRALATRETVRGPGHRATAHSLHYLGLIVWNRGEPERAEALLQRALEIRRRLFPDDHPDVVRSHNALDGLRAWGAPFPVTPGY